MNTDSLRLIRNILFRCLAIGIVFTLLLAGLTFGLWDTWTAMAIKMLHTNEAALSTLVMDFFTAIRFFLVFVLLTPALALHWTIKRDKKLAA